MEALLQDGAAVDQARTNGSTPLYIASQEGNLSVVESLLKKGADPNMATTDGVTPIQAATENNHIDILDMLREYDRRNKTMVGIAGLQAFSNDFNAAELPEDTYKYLGKKGIHYGGRRRKTRKSNKSNKSKKRRRL